eukprot:scaffold1108_cov260-Pinguiococcus_pyrenoidosus.AAC.10
MFWAVDAAAQNPLIRVSTLSYPRAFQSLPALLRPPRESRDPPIQSLAPSLSLFRTAAMKLWTLLLFTVSSAKASGVQSFLWPPQKCLLEEQEEDVISDHETDFDANGYRRISAPNASEALQAVLSLRLERFYDALGEGA